MDHLKKQIYELAQNDSMIYGSIQAYHNGDIDWNKAMEVTVIRLSEMNQRLLKDLTNIEMKYPRIIQIAEALVLLGVKKSA